MSAGSICRFSRVEVMHALLEERMTGLAEHPHRPLAEPKAGRGRQAIACEPCRAGRQARESHVTWLEGPISRNQRQEHHFTRSLPLGQQGRMTAHGEHSMAILRSEDVLENWIEVVPHSSEYAGAYLRGVMKRIDDMQLPIEHREDKAATGFIKSITGGSRSVVSINPTSKALNRLVMLLFAFPVGTSVSIGWFALLQNSGFGKGPGLRLPLIHDMDLFDNVDMRALLTSVHEFAVIPAAEALYGQAQISLDKLNRRSSGMFGIG